MMLALLRRVLRLDAGKLIAPRPRRKVLNARYDAAQTSDNNRRHWFNADGLSANAANSPQVRRTLRNRTRYEVANNSYARGIILTLANDTIGTGPRLQMLTSVDEVNSQIERAFAEWATAVRLPEKLRTLRMAKTEDGEGFAVLFSNRALATLVQLDLKLIEADQVSTPSIQTGTRNAIDGIVFDPQGNPSEYHILKQHPGDSGSASSQQFDRVSADSVLHYFRVDRPGQARGTPELTAALPLFALLRDYTIATLDAAKAAANVSGVIYTDAPANGESADVEPLDSIALDRNSLLSMPGGWKMAQVHAEQPTSTYAEFKREILNEIARCLSMPFNIAAGNSSGYNYASGRLDHQTYFKMIRVEQSHLAVNVLDRIFKAWLHEARRVDGLLPLATRHDDFIPSHQWFWDGFEHVDPNKEANAQATRLQSHTTTLAEEYAKKGRDWETELRQRAKEIALIRSLGLSSEEAQPIQPAPPNRETQETPDESNVTD